MDDRSPSQFLCHLQLLMGENTVSEAVLKQGWLKTLTCSRPKHPFTSLRAYYKENNGRRQSAWVTYDTSYTKRRIIKRLSHSRTHWERQPSHRDSSRNVDGLWGNNKSPQRPRYKSQNRSQTSGQS